MTICSTAVCNISLEQKFTYWLTRTNNDRRLGTLVPDSIFFSVNISFHVLNIPRLKKVGVDKMCVCVWGLIGW